MHTVISTFEDRGQAQRSVDRLVELGIRRGDIHIEHRGLHATSGALAAFGAFFVSLLGHDRPTEDADRYTNSVEGGKHVLVVDAMDDLQAGRAAALLAQMGGKDGNTIHRPLSRPLRDIVAVRGVLAEQAARRGKEGQAERHAVRQEQRERAFAFGGEQRQLDLREPDKPRR